MLNEPITSVSLKGKTVLLRVDINSNIQQGKPVVSARIKEHSKTIKFFSSKKAKTVVLAHQGRKGQEDFISLKGHLTELEKLVGKKFLFCSWEENFSEKISSLTDGQILLMENTRFLDFEEKDLTPEEHSKEKVIQELASVSDVFVLDALSVAHRSHASVVGFIPLLPSFAGPILEKEIINLDKALNSKEKPRLLVLGGAKPLDSFKTLVFFLKENRADKALVSGIFGELFLVASGIKFGKKDSFFESKGFLEAVPELKKLLDEFPEKIVLPEDLAVDENSRRINTDISSLPSDFISKDLGEKTIKNFSEEIMKAKLIVFNGPPGVFEEKIFSKGTKEILKAISESNAFTFLGGGDTETALTSLGFSSKDFSFVSLSGKASLNYLSGKKLVAVEALRNSTLSL
ncbi:MAG: phosphoglycerate kinase [archaeon]